MRVSASVPCFGRPERTKRLINCLDSQTINGIEIFLIGDGCPHFEKLVNSEEHQSWIQSMNSRGNRVVSFNLEKNYGGYGYHIFNYSAMNATSKYMTYIGNDDTVDVDHFEFYLSEIEGTDLDMVYYNSFIKPYGCHREAYLQPGSIGHSEVIISTDVIRRFPLHTDVYNNDWTFLKNLIESDPPLKIEKAKNPRWTYHVSAVTHHYDGVPHRLDADSFSNID